MYTLVTKILKNEYWYGGYAKNGSSMPFSRKLYKSLDLNKGLARSHSNKILLSSKGRYIWSEEGFSIRVLGCFMTIKSRSPITLEMGYHSLKGAYLDASSKYFPNKVEGPSENTFTKPTYNTSCCMGRDYTQSDVMDFAISTLKQGFGSGNLILDDGWQQCVGRWDFASNRFPNPKQMIAELHKMGFSVGVRITPFVSTECPTYDYLVEDRALIKDKKGNIAMRGFLGVKNALLDMSSTTAKRWLKKELDALKTIYGIDFFMFDGGDPSYYSKSDIVWDNVSTGEKQTELWALFSSQYTNSRTTVSVKNGNQGFVARLANRIHAFSTVGGLGSVVPSTLALGIIGQPFACADAVGGTSILTSHIDMLKYDRELLVRWIETVILMPIVEYSAPIWQLADQEIIDAIIMLRALRKSYLPAILNSVKIAKDKGEPIVRYMEYEYPHQGLEKVNRQFLIGSDIIVAPVFKKNAQARTIYLPKNTRWVNTLNNQEYQGGAPIEIKVSINDLPILKRIN